MNVNALTTLIYLYQCSIYFYQCSREKPEQSSPGGSNVQPRQKKVQPLHTHTQKSPGDSASQSAVYGPEALSIT